MTDPALVHRAEQAYLGALLARHGSGAVAGDSGPSAALTPHDFADPVHQAIFAALASQPGPQPSGITAWYERLRGLLERLLGTQAGNAAARMAELPAQCPDPANLPAYAAMVAEASGHRAGQARARLAEQAAREDPTLAGAATWLDNRREPAARPPLPVAPPPLPATVPSRAAGPADGLAPGTARLARALRAGARQASRPDPGQDRDREPSPGRGMAADPVMRGGGRPAPVRLKLEDLEERVLASLMKHPADGRAVAGWLPADAFSTPPLRDLYDLVRQRLASGRPVDPLIIAWDASRLPDIPSREGHAGAALLTRAALQAGALDPAPGTAEVLGRALWAERIITSTLGKDWTSEPERTRKLTVTEPGDPAQGPEPAPAATAQAAPARRPAPGDPSRRPGVKPAAAPAAARQPASPVPGPARPAPLRQPPVPVPDGPAQRM